ncbi:MAG TPA: hypothetical protein VMZ22_07950 [Acidimicrobiales bacterium]|nr:hypothetical protein [Acidimicrobiales bacterium]
MTTIVGITDRAGWDARTDVLVLVDPAKERLLWLPRDLWCAGSNTRINAAYRAGGHRLLVGAAAELGLAVDHTVVVARPASEAALANVAVLVPVAERLVFRYPLTPTTPIEDGWKVVTFEPPAEVLRGERIHQWIGARTGGDLHRIERQKIFFRRLLEQRFDFAGVLANPDLVRVSAPAAIDDLRQVTSSWQFETLGPLTSRSINGKSVLLYGADA